MQYRLIEKKEARLLASLDRSEKIKESYIFHDGGLVLVKSPLDIKGWIEEEVESYFEITKEHLGEGGWALGAFDGNRLIGLGSLDSRFLSGQRLKLDILYIDRSYRGKKVGSRLMTYFKEEAKRQGARSIYISASPFKNTVDFYQGQGAVLAEEVDGKLYDLEPEDIHMEIFLR